MIQNNAELIFYDYWEIDFIDILISEHVVFTTLVIIIKENKLAVERQSVKNSNDGDFEYNCSDERADSQTCSDSIPLGSRRRPGGSIQYSY